MAGGRELAELSHELRGDGELRGGSHGARPPGELIHRGATEIPEEGRVRRYDSRVGVIGVGMIGQDHIRRLTTVLSGARVVRRRPTSTRPRGEVADGCAGARGPRDRRRTSSPTTTWTPSWSPPGAPPTRSTCSRRIAAGKQVFCEKPLATTQEACLRIVDAEVAAGRRLVQVGFMRRYDAAYRALKDGRRQRGDRRAAARALPRTATRRCPSTTPGHGHHRHRRPRDRRGPLDVRRGDRGGHGAHSAAEQPRRRAAGPAARALRDRQRCARRRRGVGEHPLGYDIRGEVVGEDGPSRLGDPSPIAVAPRRAVAGRVPADWRERFVRAYDIEFQEWVDAVAGGGSTGPSAWDGYAATVVSRRRRSRPANRAARSGRPAAGRPLQ